MGQVLLPRAFAFQRDSVDAGAAELAEEEGAPQSKHLSLLRSGFWLVVLVLSACQVSAYIHREAISRIGLFAGAWAALVTCKQCKHFSIGRCMLLRGPQQTGLESGPLPDWFLAQTQE